MFDQTFVHQGKTKRGSSVMLSFIIQVVFVGVLALIPLIYTDVLPRATLTSMLTAPPPPPPPPPPPAQVVKVKVIPKQFNAGQLVAPRQIPKQVAIIQEDIGPQVNTAPAVGIPGLPGADGGLGAIAVAAPPPPPPPVKEAPKTPQQIRVGGNVQMANLIKKVTPVYPPLAKSARIQGTVKFTAVIGKDGTIQNLQLVSGHPMLVQAATDAVKQWVYKPTLLNGEPVEVITTIDVNFTLNQ